MTTRGEARIRSEPTALWLVGFALLAVLPTSTLGSRARAQNPAVEVLVVSSTPTPRVGEQFQVQVEAVVRGGATGTLTPPDFGDLQVLGSSGQMQSQSFRQVFGSPPEIETRTRVGFLLVATRPGAIQIGPASYTVGRQRFTSAPLVLKIDGSAAGSIPPQTPPNASTDTGSAMTFDSEAFLRAVVDRTEVYVGQQVTYTLYLYRSMRGTSGQALLTRQPTTDDFWTQDLLPPNHEDAGEVQMVNGMPFRVVAIMRRALFPMRVGELEIGGAELRIEPRGLRLPFGNPGAPMVRGVDALRVRARALPGGLPSTTLVGQVELSADLDRTRVTTGEAFTITLRVRGSGSLRNVALDAPRVDGLRFDPPVVEDHFDAPNDRVGGERTIQLSGVALRAGTFTIPAFRLQSFDPETNAPRELVTRGFAVVATGPTLEDDQPDGGVGAQDDVDEVATAEVEFGPPSRSSAMRRRAPPVHTLPMFRYLLAAPFVLAALAALLAAITSNVRERRAARKEKHARRPRALRDAKKAQARGDSVAFHAAISGVLHDALDRALSIHTFGMTHAELRQVLLDAADDEDLARRVIDELDAADFARFSASAGSAEEMDRTLDRASALLDRLAKVHARGVG